MIWTLLRPSTWRALFASFQRGRAVMTTCDRERAERRRYVADSALDGYLRERGVDQLGEPVAGPIPDPRHTGRPWRP